MCSSDLSVCFSVGTIDINDWKNQFAVGVMRSEKPFTIFWFIQTTLTVRCELDMMLFPFDSHNCYVEVGSSLSEMETVRMYTEDDCMFVPEDLGQTSEFSFKVNYCVSTLCLKDACRFFCIML